MWFHRCMLRQSSAGNRMRRLGESSGLVVVAFLSIGTTQFAFLTLTYPINQATQNWRDLGPEAGAMWMIRRCGPGDGNGPGPAR